MPKPPIPDELQQVLAKPNPSVIGSVTPDGAANTVATWYVWEDGRVLVNMDEGRKRLEYLRQNPRVSITILDGDSWYRHITLHGTITLETTRTSTTSTGSPSTTPASPTRSATAAV